MVTPQNSFEQIYNRNQFSKKSFQTLKIIFARAHPVPLEFFECYIFTEYYEEASFDSVYVHIEP